MRSSRLVRSSAVVCLVLSAVSLVPRRVEAGINLKRAAIKLVICAGTAYAGFKIGDKVANLVIARMKLAGPEAERMRKSVQIGTAAALCGTSVLLTGTVYNALSKRDREAREREMAAALEDATPGTRSYVLPESGLPGRLETDEASQDGDKQCRRQVEYLGKESEPASSQWCRKNPKDKYELELGV